MDADPDALPDDVAPLKAALVAAREQVMAAEAEIVTVHAQLSNDQRLIASRSTTDSPALAKPIWSHCDSGAALRPIRAKGRPTPSRAATMASGSLS